MDFHGPPDPITNTASYNTVTREVCNTVDPNIQLSHGTKDSANEIELQALNSQDPLSVGVHLCGNGTAHSKCLFGGACDCADNEIISLL